MKGLLAFFSLSRSNCNHVGLLLARLLTVVYLPFPSLPFPFLLFSGVNSSSAGNALNNASSLFLWEKWLVLLGSRARITQQRKYAMGRRVFWPLVMVALLTASLGMLCSMLEGKEMDMGTVFAPLWTAIAIVGLATMRSNPRNT